MDEQAIGENIRQLRLRSGLSLTEVARRAELSKSALSKLETGQMSSPVSTLIRIADALEMPLAQFFEQREEQPSFVHTKSGKGRVITQSGSQFGYAYEALALDLPGKWAEPFLLTISPDDPVGEFQHSGQEFIYVVDGQLEFTVGDEVIDLRKGDSIYFDPTQVHTTRVVGKKAAKLLCVFLLERPPTGRGGAVNTAVAPKAKALKTKRMKKAESTPSTGRKRKA